jgi:hypothetical protein
MLPAGDMSQAQTETAIGRIGDALIDCRARHALLVTWSAGVAESLTSKGN